MEIYTEYNYLLFYFYLLCYLFIYLFPIPYMVHVYNISKITITDFGMRSKKEMKIPRERERARLPIA